jgi:hypothetical protein
MDELADTFCERCGTRYTFRPAPTPKSQYVGRAKVIARGLRHFVMNDGSSMDEALRAARIDTGAEEATRVTEEFHKTFNFCMVCRQYACDKCWNENQGACLSCAPLWDEPAVAPADQLLQRPAKRSRKGSGQARPSEWPAEDVEVAQAQAARNPSRGAPRAAEPDLGAFEAAARAASRSRPSPTPRAAPSRDELIGAAQPPAPAPRIPAPEPSPLMAAPEPASRMAPEPAPRNDLPTERTPSWVTQKVQDEAEQLRAKSQTWMSRDDAWALWPADDGADGMPADGLAPAQPPIDKPLHPRRTPAETGPAPAEPADRRRSRNEAASAEPLAYEQAAGTRRASRPAPEPPSQPAATPPAPAPAAPALKRGQRPAALPAGVDERLGFDLIGSLRTAADAAEPTEPPHQPRTQVVGRILGRKTKPAEPDAAAPQPQPKSQQQPKSQAAPKPAPSRSHDRNAAPQPSWPQPTAWQNRPIAQSEEWADELYPPTPPAEPVVQTPPRFAPQPSPEPAFRQPPAPQPSAPQPTAPQLPAFDRQALIPPPQPPTRLVAPPPMSSDAALAMSSDAALAMPSSAPPAMPSSAPPAMPSSATFAMPPATTERWQTPPADLPVAPATPPRPEWQLPESAVDPWSPAPAPRPAPRNIITPRPLSETPWAQPTPPSAARSRKGRHEEPPESPLVAELWAESAQQVIDLGTTQVCVSCGLPVSTQARFCRRCGSRQD